MTQHARRISVLQRVGFLLRFTPLLAALQFADWIAPVLRARWPRREKTPDYKPGISIVVPERGTPDLLASTLAALAAAGAAIDEACQVIVVVNGAAESEYTHLRERHAEFEWQFHRDPLGYNGAICAGISRARNDWTYLLNSDMRLDLRALAEILPYRQSQVFAIASQIFFEDATRRREETGWSDFVADTDPPVVYEREPGAGTLARGSHYAGGGSSLFQTAILRRYARASQVYNPFYWEDADWGVHAWNDGLMVLFCPTSHAWHQHRGTVNRYYDKDEVQRVIERNAQWFDMRHARSAARPIEHLRRIAARAPQYWNEFAGIGNAWNAFRLRLRARGAQRCGMPYAEVITGSFYSPGPAQGPQRPRVMLVSPFGLFPPAHGGARRVAELVSRLADRVDFILLSDEASLYTLASEPWLRLVRATHLVEGRGDLPDEAALPLGERMHRHAWPGLRRELCRLINLYDPNIVQIEFMELASLADERGGRDQRWLLALHDVYLQGAEADDAEQRVAISRYDAVSACSQEDLDLLDHARKTLIPNGAVDRRASYEPSPQAPAHLLFMGPFRYAQNQAGILEFLDSAWPPLRHRFPDLRLTILGGIEAARVVAADARLRQPGVDTICDFVDPLHYLRACTLTINPQTAIRGSSIKLIESLLAGRICVSTRDGARGFGDDQLRELVVAHDIAAMASRIDVLLADPRRRHALERPDDSSLDNHTWTAVAERQLELYRRLSGSM